MKKQVKQLVVLLLALILSAALGAPAFADNTKEDGYSITVKNDSSVTNVSIEGEIFCAYKIFDVTYTAETHEETEDGETVTVRDSYAYTISSESAWFAVVKSYLGSDDTLSGKGMTLTPTASDPGVYNVTIEEDTFSARDFADHLGKWLNDGEGSKPEGTKFDAGEAKDADGVEKATVRLSAPGYYLVTSQGHTDGKEEGGEDGKVTVVAAAALYTTDPDAEIDLKADAPAITKKIVENGSPVDANNAAVGDTVSYKITSEVPDMTGYKNYFFVVSDTLSGGLTFNNDIIVKVGEKTLAADTDYAVEQGDYTETDGTAIAIVFKNFIQYAEEKNSNIEITYSATVNENAVIGTKGNPNKVALTYSNNPNVDTDGDKPDEGDPAGTTPESEVRTYVTGVLLKKIDKSSPAMPLKGAEFKIEGTSLNTVLVSKETFAESENGEYWKLKDGTYTTQAPDDTNPEKYEDTETKYSKEVTYEKTEKSAGVSYEGTVGEDGVLSFNGLSAGEYTITEIKAPDGYNLLTGPLKLNIGWTAPADGSTACKWSREDGSADKWSDGEDGIFTIDVENGKGTLLPETGGIGTTVFYVVGGVLMTAALGLIVLKKH